MRHPDRDVLEEYANDVLDERWEVEAHLAGCAPCTGIVDAFRAEEAALGALLGGTPVAARSRRWAWVPIAAALAIFAVLVFLRPSASERRPADTSRVRPPGRIEQVVARADEEEIYALGWKALPVLRRRRGEAKIDALIGRIEARPPRVLYIEHPPRYEFRYLKNALIRDPELLVQAFLTSADDAFPQEHSKDASDPAFREGLKEVPSDFRAYEVVIVGDVPAERLPLKAMEEFVREWGGGIYFLGSQQADAYPRTLVPVEKVSDAESAGAYEVVDRDHPIVKTLKSWEALQPLRWHQAVERVAPEARVLVRLADGKSSPLFVVRGAGRGRVFWSGTDDTWLWRHLVGDAPNFYPFHRGVIDWLAGR